MRNVIGWLEHGFIGLLVTALSAALHEPPAHAVVWVAIAGVVHEGSQGFFSDFRHAANPKAPLNGALDLLAFMPAAVLWWAYGH